MKTVLLTVALVVMGGVAFGISEGFESYPLGDLNGQGSATGGWAGSWLATHSSLPTTDVYMVAAGGSPGSLGQHLAIVDLESNTYKLRRDLETALTGSWTTFFDLKLTSDGTQEEGTRGRTLITLRGTNGTAGARLIIGGNSFEMCTLNGDTNYQVVQYGDAAFPNMKPLVEGADWVKIGIQYTEADGRFRLLWEQQDGSMLVTGPDRGPRQSTWNGTFAYLEIDEGRIGADGPENQGLLVDNITIIPEPMTLALLGLGSLGLIGRKRR